MELFHSFSQLSNVPLSICLHIYVYIIVYICFIHSVNGQLGCFHDLVLVSSAAMNTEVRIFFLIIFLYMPRNGIAGSYF